MLNIRTDLEKSMIKYEKTTNKKKFLKKMYLLFVLCF